MWLVGVGVRGCGWLPDGDRAGFGNSQCGGGAGFRNSGMGVGLLVLWCNYLQATTMYFTCTYSHRLD